MRDLIAAFGRVVNLLTVIVAALAVLVFFWGLAKFIFKSGDESARTEGKNLMIYGVITLFIMFSIFGLTHYLVVALGINYLPTLNDLPPIRVTGG